MKQSKEDSSIEELGQFLSGKIGRWFIANEDGSNEGFRIIDTAISIIKLLDKKYEFHDKP